MSHTTDLFVHRHIGPTPDDVQRMVAVLGYASLEACVQAVVPAAIVSHQPLHIGPARSETEVLQELKALAAQNQIYRSYLGMGYHDCITPPVIQRNVLENPGWYTPYTPYQAEISQGRLEALLNFQTMVSDLTSLPMANASLLDEATAAAEAMTFCWAIKGDVAKSFFVSDRCHPQTIAVVKTRALPLGIEVIVGPHATFDFGRPIFGALLQYPTTDGVIHDYSSFITQAHAAKALVVVAADLLSLTLLRPPGEFGADVAVGSTQRFGVPLGYGGPHAAYFATREEFKRQMPGRLIGVSIDQQGRRALRLALQTREQHIRRAKATSNICTAQALLAVVASMYAIYHGPDGLRRMAERIHGLAGGLAAGLRRLGYAITDAHFFDTIAVPVESPRADALIAAARTQRMNLRRIDATTIGIAMDETTTVEDVNDLLQVFAQGQPIDHAIAQLVTQWDGTYPAPFQRTSRYLTHPIFHQYHSETELMRYMTRLQARDITLTTAMTPLGSCTMKLNAAAEMLPITWPEFNRLHPFAPTDQTQGYAQLIKRLETMLIDITGFPAISLQPNAGSQGEYAGLVAIHQYHASRGEGHRHICLIPTSAHGTNPASAAMAGMTIVAVDCDAQGNIDLRDLERKATAHAKDLAALIVTYPSTHGVFEEGIKEICNIIHRHGGQVYMDGANMNALVGLCRPAEFGVDVCHLNLHKTFCIPHGGGGPGMGPIAVHAHLAPFLPSHPVIATGGEKAAGAVAAAPWGSASILPIAYAYIAMMGSEGLRRATAIAIVNANYVAKRLEPYYPVLFRGRSGLVAHECIVDLRALKASVGIEVEDVAKRLMDYGFHAPTISWPIAGTMMIEPTESESLAELDRFCTAMIAIYHEVQEIVRGETDRENNVVKNAPHPAAVIVTDPWDHPYSREKAAFPAPWCKEHKYWPPVSRINNPYGDRHLVCTCPSVEEIAS